MNKNKTNPLVSLSLKSTLILAFVFIYCSPPPPLVIKTDNKGSVEKGQVTGDATSTDASAQDTHTNEQGPDTSGPTDTPAPDDNVQHERDPDLPPGGCHTQKDCQLGQVCDQGKCFGDCTQGAICFTGDKCDTARKRCLCNPPECKKAGRFCGRKGSCLGKCNSDADCVPTERCIGQKCKDPNVGPPEKRPEPVVRKKLGEDCSSSPCDFNLLCVKTNEGKSTCLKPCSEDIHCNAPQKCAKEALSGGRGLCANIRKEGESCSTSKSMVCQSGFRCKNAKCERRNRVSAFDQCDNQHICTPNTLVCVGFGKEYGSLCLKTCTVGQSGVCAKDEKCISPGGGPANKGLCLYPCKAVGDRCPHPHLRCNQLGSGEKICTPQGSFSQNVEAAPCGGPYGKCFPDTKCRVVFKASGIGVCAADCKNGTCKTGFSCLQTEANGPKACLKSCSGAGGKCSRGMHCSPVVGGWACVP